MSLPAEGAALAADVPLQMIALGLLILAAHLGGRLFNRLRLSVVTGQLLGGAVVGPYVLHLLGFLRGTAYDEAMHSFQFFIFVFLSVVAFGIGEELHMSRLRKVGRDALVICLVQGALTWFLITASFRWIAGFDLVQSLLIGSIGIATAPAVTFVLMNQLNIEGRLRHVLGSLVVLDDLIEVIIFSILMQISLQQIHQESVSGWTVLGPVGKEVFFAVITGGVVFIVLRLLIHRRPRSLDREEDETQGSTELTAFLQRILAEHPSPSVEILLVVMGAVSLGAGIAYLNHWPFLITATLAGFLIANFHTHAIFDSLKIDHLAAALNLGFFALIGAHIDLSQLGGTTAWLAGLYVLSRFVGKIAGTWLGCRMTRQDAMVTRCLPALMLPQAGVAAVEAVYASAVLGLPEISAIILPAIVFFEVVGVFLVDRGLRKWREIAAVQEEASSEDRPVAGPAAAARLLLSHVSREHITFRLKGAEKKAIIEQLVDHAIAHTDQHVDRVQTLQVLGERENMSSTGVGNGVGLPHCRLMGLDRPVLVFGRHPDGVEFDGVDDIPCTLFLLMLSSARDPAQHLRLLAAAGRLLGDDALREKLHAAHTPRRFLQVLKDVAD